MEKDRQTLPLRKPYRFLSGFKKPKRFPLYLFLLVFLLAGCATSPTFLQPNSLVSSKEADLFRIILYMSIGVFVLVWVLLLVNIIAFRQRDPEDKVEPRQKYGNFRLEIIWTAIPIVLVLILFVLTMRTMQAVAAPAPAQSDVNITVIGHQWWWEFDYPDLGIVTANEMHVPVGANVKMVVTSADVIHSFWVPQLANKVDAIPGQNNNLWFQAQNLGTFDGQCAEFCGLNHANMRVKVVVESDTDFQAWVANQQAPLVQPANDQQQQAYNLITKGICSTCHTLGDNKGATNIGPNLTHLMSRSVFAGAMYDMNITNLHDWLSDPQALKPGNKMIVNLTPDQVNTLMSYLTELK